MTRMISNRDWEALSAYLDGELSTRDRTRLEAALESSSDLRAALEELRRTRIILRSQSPIRAPRNFTLTPQMAGIQPKKEPAFRLFPAMRLTSALATLLLVFVVLGDFFLGASQSGAPAMMEEPMMESASQMLQVVTEAPRIVDEIVESDVVAEAEMAEKSFDLTAEITLESPAFVMPSQGEGLAAGEELLPLAGTMGPPPTITLPTDTPTTPPTAITAVGRNQDDETGPLEESLPTGAVLIRSRLALSIVEVSLALLGVITAVIAFYLRPSKTS